MLFVLKDVVCIIPHFKQYRRTCLLDMICIAKDMHRSKEKTVEERIPATSGSFCCGASIERAA